MPTTTNFGFDYESPTSLPGTTLTGGQTSTSPILAVQIDSALAALETSINAQTTTIAMLEGNIADTQDEVDDLMDWTQTGAVSMSFSSVVSATTAVNFGFTFPVAPVVTTNIDSGAGPTARWESRAINLTTTGFTMFVYQSQAISGSWTDIPVNWLAVYRP